MTCGVKNNTFNITFPFDRLIIYQFFSIFFFDIFDIRLHTIKLKSDFKIEIFSGVKIPIREAVSMCAMSPTQVIFNAVVMRDIN